MFKIIFFLAMLQCMACSSTQQSTIYKADEKVSIDQFIQDAISQGLKKDKITAQLAADVAAIDRFFIAKCEICKNVRSAFTNHKGSEDAAAMTGQVELIKKIKKQDTEGKMAFQSVVNSYLSDHLKKSGLGKVQKEKMKQLLKEEAKKGSMLITIYNFCPSCDGTKGACQAAPSE